MDYSSDPAGWQLSIFDSSRLMGEMAAGDSTVTNVATRYTGAAEVGEFAARGDSMVIGLKPVWPYYPGFTLACRGVMLRIASCAGAQLGGEPR